MTDKTATELTVPDIWYKGKRVLRTIVAALTGALTVWAGFQLVAPQVLAELAKVLPGSWILWLTGAIASVSAVAGVITRLMAIPAFNALLVKVGLGSVPESSLIEAKTIENGQVHEITTVAPDPKAITPDAPVIVDGREQHPNVG